MNTNVDMKVKDLKAILNELPDDMDVIIPVISPDDVRTRMTLYALMRRLMALISTPRLTLTMENI